ncbi:hypothetical protein FQN53_009623 [Emmonsiellopsis sp. PD_33]|nr:hypothetical protein FQN53_009623 [Emmonsiellopsis sp. PD_33]
MAPSQELPETMKALRYYGRGDVRIDEIPPQPCGADEVRIKIAFCGICGSDLHEYLGGPLLTPKVGEKHHYTGAELPITMGHELSGVLVDVGSEISSSGRLEVGQRVVINPCISDRQLGFPPCAACEEGKTNCCLRFAGYGLNGLGGGYSEYLVVKASHVFRLPDSVSLEIGALVEPLAVAWHCVQISGFQSGQDVVVLGGGPIGLALLLVLKVRKARTIIVSEVLEMRQQYARSFGADFVINPLEEQEAGVNPVVAKAREVSGEQSGGVHVVFDTTGIQKTFDTAVASTRTGGVVFNVAIHEKPLLVNLNDITTTEKKLMGGMCYTDDDFKAVIDMLDKGLIDAKPMITSIVPLDSAITKGFQELIERKEFHVKILVQAHPDPV